ncbi:MAG TPA: hypothetical protein VGW58_14005, partial [Pyrinomonadaceae bacterium]|nr:hypothetical protein [Pyrinomonadaceae bacterium]
ASIYGGRWAAVDEELIKEGRLQRLANRDELQKLNVEKKHVLQPRRASGVIDEVVSLIFE